MSNEELKEIALRISEGKTVEKAVFESLTEEESETLKGYLYNTVTELAQRFKALVEAMKEERKAFERERELTEAAIMESRKARARAEAVIARAEASLLERLSLYPMGEA